MQMVKKERNSSIELLKILAVILIVLSHSMPIKTLYTFDKPSLDVQHLVFQLFFFLGQLGNIIFIACSGYFLFNSKKTKLYKIIDLLLDVIIVVVAFCVVESIKERTFSINFFAYRIYLVVVGQEFGFIACYLILYLIHPLLNYIIKNLSQTKYLLLCILYLVLYAFTPILVYFIFGTTSAHKSHFGSSLLLSFIGLYFLINYVKLYGDAYRKNTKLNVLILLVSCLFLGIIIFFVNFLGMKISKYSYGINVFNGISSPILIIIGISLLNLFSTKHFVSKLINTISSLSLFVYVFSENFFMLKLKHNYFNWLYNKYAFNKILIWCLLLAVVTFIGSVIVGIIYKYTIKIFISKANNKFCDFIEEKGKKLLTNIVEKSNNKVEEQ